MFPDLTELVVHAKLDDIRREVERDRLANVARATATAYGDRRKGFRRLFAATGRMRHDEVTPRTLVPKPAT
jgi:hypothetical protein